MQIYFLFYKHIDACRVESSLGYSKHLPVRWVSVDTSTPTPTTGEPRCKVGAGG